MRLILTIGMFQALVKGPKKFSNRHKNDIINFMMKDGRILQFIKIKRLEQF